MFNWFTGKSQSNLPGPTALQSQRSRQIEQLKSFNQNVSEIQRDVEYRISILVNGTSLSLHITLPPDFPQDKPVVKVAPNVRHPWVNEQMIVVGSAGINEFMVHSDLGKVIREIIEEFLRYPPIVLQSQNSFGTYSYSTPAISAPAAPQSVPSYAYSNSTSQPELTTYISDVPVALPREITAPGPPDLHTHLSGTVNCQLPDTNTGMGPSNYGGYKMPDLPANFHSQLGHLSKLELQELLDNEDKLLTTVQGLPEIQQISSDRERFCEENARLARENMSLKPVLEERKRTLLEKYDLFNDVKEQYDNNFRLQEELQQHYDPRVIQEKIKAAALEADEQSEVIAENFLEGKIDVDEFKKDYMDKRKLGHLRHAKEERLGQSRVRLH